MVKYVVGLDGSLEFIPIENQDTTSPVNLEGLCHEGHRLIVPYTKLTTEV